jgi:GT2 family glycosyltransferase
MPGVSAIIVNYNAGLILNEAVKSLLCSASVAKVLVVDNGSTDHSMDEMERLANSQSRLISIYNKTNLGFAKACNIAIAAAGENDYLLFLNPDCLINKDALETLLACMKSSPQAGMAGPLLLNPDGTEQAGGRRAIPTPWRSFARAFGLSRLRELYPRLFSDFLLHQQPLPNGPAEVEAISGSCMLVRRDALLDVGPMDGGYFMHCEDLDWCMRFRQRSWKILFVPDARVVHHKGTCSKARPIFVEWHKHKGMMRFYRKFFRHQYPGVLFWIVGFGVWLRFGAVAVYHNVRHLKRWLKHDRR